MPAATSKAALVALDPGLAALATLAGSGTAAARSLAAARARSIGTRGLYCFGAGSAAGS